MEIKSLVKNEKVQEKFQDLLGLKKSKSFLDSVVHVVSDNNLLKKADPNTVLTAAVTAASLDLPLNKSLGFSWIVPYNEKDKETGRFVCKAQFQIGWRGFVQLAIRTRQYKTINVIDVYENQYNGYNSLTEELDADFSIDGEGEVVGYVAYFKLISGFSKTSYWSKAKVERHGSKFSKTYKNKYSVWKTDFDAMARKTVLKNTLSKWGIMSIEMNTALQADQSVQTEEGMFEYVDNETQAVEVILPTLDENHKSYLPVLNKLKMGSITIEQVKKHYTISLETEKALQDASK